MKGWMMRCVVACVSVCCVLFAVGCEMKKKEGPPTKISENPKTRAGQMVKEAKDTRKKLEDRNEAVGEQLDGVLKK